MTLTPTHLNYYLICHRKCWLFAHGIQMEQTSDKVYEGKLTGETSYGRRAKKYTELDLGNAKIDFYDAGNKVVHEVKQSNKMEHAHEWQVKYYLYLLEKAGIEGATGLLEYPKLRETKEVLLEPEDRGFLQKTLGEIQELIKQGQAPPTIDKPFCKKCSYHDFCYAGEMIEED